MIIATLELPNLFKGIRCVLNKNEKKYYDEMLFSHFCTNCGQTFIAKFDWVNFGLSKRWKGNFFKCPFCGRESTDVFYSSHYKNNTGVLDEPGKDIPINMMLTLYEYKEKIKLHVSTECIQFDKKHPEKVTYQKNNEDITFDIKKQTTTFRDTNGNETSLENPLNPVFPETSMLQYLDKNSDAWQERKPEVHRFLKKLRETICNKIYKIKKYQLKAIAIAEDRQKGMLLNPLRNIAWRLAITDGPNMKECYLQSETNNEDGQNKITCELAPNLTEEDFDKIIKACQKGKSYPQAVLEAFGIPDTKSGRKLAAKASVYTLSIIKAIAETNLDQHGKKQFKDIMEERYNNWNTLNAPDYFRSKKLMNKNAFELFKETMKQKGQTIALQLLTNLRADELNDAGNLYETLTEEEKETMWKKAGSVKKIHDICSEMNWRHKHPDYNLDVPEHIVNRLMMQKENLKFYLPETYHELHEAGNELSNCVGGTYPKEMKNGLCCIVLVADKNGKLKVCIEIRKDTIIQAKLYGNQCVRKEPDTNKAILEWAKEKKLKINTEDIDTTESRKKKLKKAV